VLIRTAADLGAVIRERRKQLNLDQAELAKRIGVSRQWVIGIERGRARAELGLVLRTLDALGIRLSGATGTPSSKTSSSPDIDAIIAAAKTGAR
jgi:HTH-type transcriptional regulator/antitoxin HipB